MNSFFRDMKKTLTGMLAMLFVVMTGTASAEIVVIGHPGLSAGSLDKSTVSKLFLGKMRDLPGGGTAVVFDQQDGSEIKAQFYTKAADKNPVELKSYWARMIFSGKGAPPDAVEGGDTAVKQRVASSSNAIGYIDAGSVDKSVKVLFRLQ